MSRTPHDLHDEFPHLADRIGELKQSDRHFARLADEYDSLNRAINRAETHVEPVDDLTEVGMRKKRGLLKDEIYRLLTA